VYDWLLFLHVLSAFALVVTVVVFSAFALGAAIERRVLIVGSVMWAIGALGTLVFGVWLAIYVKGYEVWDGWVIAALVLWAIATELGRRAEEGFRAGAAPEGGAVPDGGAVTTVQASQAALWHWLRSVAVLALLVVMIYKPGA
jgi:hypothetical protein